ncbi:hypothetical protein QYF61_020944 [Mycteria americana]|uniref:Uncharacterized protein n=1 Tax=Mycteria americana TaxID=33587 RepID=A0AAN7NXR2_MYCAM|nr:hypothetical protein QYF61_020944 [Mycteria americana]
MRVNKEESSSQWCPGWRLNHLPGQPVPMLDNPFSEVKFPNIQSKPPLAQLEAISSHPIPCYLGEETDPHLSTTSFQAVVESHKVSPQPPFRQTKQPQLPQPLLIRLLLQTLHQLRCPSLDTLQHLNVPLGVGGPKLNTVFESLVCSGRLGHHLPEQWATATKARSAHCQLYRWSARQIISVAGGTDGARWKAVQLTSDGGSFRELGRVSEEGETGSADGFQAVFVTLSGSHY